jgi:hypothetical protein
MCRRVSCRRVSQAVSSLSVAVESGQRVRSAGGNQHAYPSLLAVLVRPASPHHQHRCLVAVPTKHVPEEATDWKTSPHIIWSRPWRCRHRMLRAAASWHGSRYSLRSLLFAPQKSAPQTPKTGQTGRKKARRRTTHPSNLSLVSWSQGPSWLAIIAGCT